MAKIAYLLLCHKDPEGIIAQAERLTAAGDFVAIHFDAPVEARRTSSASARRLADNPSVALRRAARCLRLGRVEPRRSHAAAVDGRCRGAFRGPRISIMLSGDCMPIKSAEYAHAFLDRDGRRLCRKRGFLRLGLDQDGDQGRAADLPPLRSTSVRTSGCSTPSMDLQKRLGLERQDSGGPADADRQPVVVPAPAARSRRSWLSSTSGRDVLRFFRTPGSRTRRSFRRWCAIWCPRREIDSRTLTFLMFSDYGMPVTLLQRPL